MAAFQTPAAHARRAELYYQLSTMLGAGIALVPALELLLKDPTFRFYRPAIRRLLDHLQQGATFAEALSASGSTFNTFDITLLEVGEQTGRLENSFRILSGQYRERARLMRLAVGACIHPMLTLHMAVLVFPTSALVAMVKTGDILGFLWPKLMVLGVLYGVIYAFFTATDDHRTGPWRAVMERLLGVLPLVGKARHTMAVARLSSALEALVSAGVGVVRGWELAAAASGSTRIMQAVAGWREAIYSGTPPGDLMVGSEHFPETFVSLYRSGELSGRLDDTLRRLRDYYQEEASQRFEALARWLPRLVYVLVVMGIVYMIFDFYSGYFKNMQSITGALGDE